MNERIRRSRSQPGTVTLDSVPDRGSQDIHGNTFDGLTRLKLKYRDLVNDNLADGAVNNRTIGEQINPGNLPNIGGLQGDLPQEKLPNVPENKLPGTVVLRKELPDFSKFATDTSVQARTTPSQVKNLIKNMVKKNALQ